MKRIFITALLTLVLLTSCADPSSVGKAPSDSPISTSEESMVETVKKEDTEPTSTEISTEAPAKQILFSDKGIEVEYIGVEETNSRVTAELKVVNNTADKVVIACFITAVNDFSMDGYAGDGYGIPAGESITIKPYIRQKYLDEQFVSAINSIDIAFSVIVNADIIVNNANLRVLINDGNDLDIEERELYNKDGFRFLTYRSGESAPLFCFENNSTVDASIFVYSVELDGKTVEAEDILDGMVATGTGILPGKKAVLDFSYDNGINYYYPISGEHNFFIEHADSDIVMSFEIILEYSTGEINHYITEPFKVEMQE